MRSVIIERQTPIMDIETWRVESAFDLSVVGLLSMLDH
jgi:hypothetical protein